MLKKKHYTINKINFIEVIKIGRERLPFLAYQFTDF